MNPNAVKQLIILVLCCIAAVMFGTVVASQDYENLLLLSYLLLGVYVLATPGFVPLIAFGLLNPFILPIPYYRSFAELCRQSRRVGCPCELASQPVRRARSSNARLPGSWCGVRGGRP